MNYSEEEAIFIMEEMILEYQDNLIEKGVVILENNVKIYIENGVCYGAVEPKHDILPLLAPHFIRRYVNMPFIIHDIIRNRCLVYNGSEYGIFETENMPRLTLSDTEKNYRNLWKSFYDTIAIAERKNEKCRMTHLPKHYRRCMTEFF